MSRRHLLLLIGVLSGACNDPQDGTADAAGAPREVVTSTKLLIASELGESILQAGAGDRAVIHITASAPTLDWNIHGHANGGTQTISEGFAQNAVEYSFEPTATADWYLLVRNSSATASLELEVSIDLYGAVTWSGWE